MEPGGQTSGVEVAPGPLLGVVIEGLALALRAGPEPGLVVGERDVDTPLLDGQLDIVDEPRIDKAEHLGVELDVAHGGLLPLALRAPGDTPVSPRHEPFATD